jgi:hypothetical protein
MGTVPREGAAVKSLGDTVLTEGRYRGAVKATGTRLDVQMAHVWDVRDGKIVRFQQYVDTWHRRAGHRRDPDELRMTRARRPAQWPRRRGIMGSVPIPNHRNA